MNNAGAIRGGDFLKIPDEQWAGDWSLKILGYVRMARAVFPIMQAQGGGRIVNVVGAAARNPTPGYLPGGIANSGLINFSKGLADLGAPQIFSSPPCRRPRPRPIAGRADRPAGGARGQDRRGAARGSREPLSAEADRDSGGHRRSRLLSGIGARRVHHRRVHHRRRRRDARRLPVILPFSDQLDMRHPLSYICAPARGKRE